MSTNEASSKSNSVSLFRSSRSEVSSSQRHRGSRERRPHDGGGSTCDTDTQSQIQSDLYHIPMPQAVPSDELIQPHFAFQQIPPCIYEAPRQEINSAGDLIFDFNFDQYQALSQQRRAAYEIEQQQQYQYHDQSRD